MTLDDRDGNLKRLPFEGTSLKPSASRAVSRRRY